MAAFIAGDWRCNEAGGMEWRRKSEFGGGSASWNQKVLSVLSFRRRIPLA